MSIPTGTEVRPALAFIGAGRAGGALASALHAASYPVVAIHSRDKRDATALAALVGAATVSGAFAAATAAPVVFLTVPDSQIMNVAAAVAASGVMLQGTTIIHCSGAFDREILAALRITGAAVANLHPLQALAGVESVKFLRGSGFAVDVDLQAMTLVEAMVRDLGGVLLPIGGVDRRIYHAAAVLAGNAPLAILNDAVELLQHSGLRRELAEQALLSLLSGAIANAQRLGIEAALTGPAARGDYATIAAHLEALRNEPRIAELYRLLTAELLRLSGNHAHAA